MPPATASHDHRLCVAEALVSAERLCTSRGVKLTELRRRVLELVWGSHRPIGAYDLMSKLAGKEAAVAPPTVYRALAFLQRQGLVHRLASRNAFVGCTAPGELHAAQFLLCRGCDTVAELTAATLASGLIDEAAKRGFAIERVTVEVEGLCAECRAAADQGDSPAASRASIRGSKAGRSATESIV